MNKRNILAVKVMDFLNEYTATAGWVFKLDQVNDSYVISTTLKHRKGTDMTIAYIIEKDCARLRVISNNSKCTSEYLKEKVMASKLNFNIGGLELENSEFALESLMTLDTLKEETYTIANERMTAMMKIITDIANETAN